MKVESARGHCVQAMSNNELITATRALVGRSNELSAKLIAHLAEVDARKLYLEEAQPSMFAWCIAELGCSEPTISTMHLLRPRM